MQKNPGKGITKYQFSDLFKEEELKYISKFLVQSVPAAKCDPKPTQRVSGARVFTSEECSYKEVGRKGSRKEKEGGKTTKLEWERKRREREEIAAEKKEEKRRQTNSH